MIPHPLRAGLPPLPSRFAHLRIDARGYPVPWFVAWFDGVPDFRVLDPAKLRVALLGRRCWLCGERLGSLATYVIGPMCCVNRTTAEPPCHLECAQFAAIACPFLTLPGAQRREAKIPQDTKLPPGEMIRRNPGVTLLWTCRARDVRAFKVDNGKLFRLVGEPASLEWYARGRRATRAEVLESIESGLPTLRKLAEDQGAAALAELKKLHERARAYLPREEIV